MQSLAQSGQQKMESLGWLKLLAAYRSLSAHKVNYNE